MTSKQASIYFPGEWAPQDYVQLTWPHLQTDWAYCIEEAYNCFIAIATAIVKYQKLIVVCSDIQLVQNQLKNLNQNNILYYKIESNDTWARDHGGITVFIDGKPTIYDFKFNGWGLKFASNFDNQITKQLFAQGCFTDANYSHQLDFIFEGGGIESNGNGILMTTAECLLSKNRNEQYSKQDIEQKLLTMFGAKKLLWIENGYLAGDDTDSHIDTLARFVSETSIMYVQCTDPADEHYSALFAMEQELKACTDLHNKPFKLIALPMCPAIFDENEERIPATYANFLFINNAVLIPIYNCQTDSQALEIFKQTFPDKEIIGIDCSVLIKQHGSLHCVTMQYPILK